MPFALLIIGLVLLIASVRNTTSGPNGLFALVQGEFTGPNNFLYWMTAILVIGFIGYVPKLKPLSTAFLGLVVVVLFLSKGVIPGGAGGFFQQFTQGLASTNSQAAATPAAPATGAATTGGGLTFTPPAGTPAISQSQAMGAGGLNLPSLPSLSNFIN